MLPRLRASSSVKQHNIPTQHRKRTIQSQITANNPQYISKSPNYFRRKQQHSFQQMYNPKNRAFGYGENTTQARHEILKKLYCRRPKKHHPFTQEVKIQLSNTNTNALDDTKYSSFGRTRLLTKVISGKRI